MNKLIKIPFSGFYESYHIDAIDRELEIMFMDDDGNVDYDQANELDVNYTKVLLAYSKSYVEQLKNETGIDSLKFRDLQSPQYYNFETDVIFCTISLKDIRHMRKVIIKQKMDDVCRELFTSHEGFISNYNPQWYYWPNDVKQWDCNQLYALMLAFVNEEYLETNIIEQMNMNGDIMQAFDSGIVNYER